MSAFDGIGVVRWSSMGAGDLPQLRYVDGPTTEASIDIAAPPERVWALVTDLQLPARFSNEFHGAELLDGATCPAVGSPLRRAQPPPGDRLVGDDVDDHVLRTARGPRLRRRRQRRPAVGVLALLARADGRRHPPHAMDAHRSRAQRHQPGDRRDAGEGVEDPPPPPRRAPREHGGHARRDQGPGRGMTRLAAARPALPGGAHAVYGLR